MLSVVAGYSEQVSLPESVTSEEAQTISGGLVCAVSPPMPNTGCAECIYDGQQNIIILGGEHTYHYSMDFWAHCELNRPNSFCSAIPAGFSNCELNNANCAANAVVLFTTNDCSNWAYTIDGVNRRNCNRTYRKPTLTPHFGVDCIGIPPRVTF